MFLYRSLLKAKFFNKDYSCCTDILERGILGKCESIKVIDIDTAYLLYGKRRGSHRLFLLKESDIFELNLSGVLASSNTLYGQLTEVKDGFLWISFRDTSNTFDNMMPPITYTLSFDYETGERYGRCMCYGDE